MAFSYPILFWPGDYKKSHIPETRLKDARLILCYNFTRIT
ncbi:hypothetical protein HMPREF3213_02538 [Heyndrickxia coagulans]|uniref:Uncharacterized protein n=1 Tax=Heyndrickxia coagulans TaxID=1398 RepID=A0A133KJD3_HEYCO|nr:hypothetical protein HMPREF3213_02538 [Heyndrickxia coagulans]